MEYVFGTKGNIEVLKTKGATHSDLTGYRQVERVYPDQTVTDHFRVVRKLNSEEDSEGNCYDWYEIDRHYRATDKTAPVAMATAANAAAIASMEDALCELDAIINGGETA